MEDEVDVTNYHASQRDPDLFVLKANSAGKFVSLLGNSVQAVKQLLSFFLSFFKFSPTKHAPRIDWATHFPCIKVFAVWGAQFISPLVNRLKAAASP